MYRCWNFTKSVILCRDVDWMLSELWEKPDNCRRSVNFSKQKILQNLAEKIKDRKPKFGIVSFPDPCSRREVYCDQFISISPCVLCLRRRRRLSAQEDVFRSWTRLWAGASLRQRPTPIAAPVDKINWQMVRPCDVGASIVLKFQKRLFRSSFNIIIISGGQDMGCPSTALIWSNEHIAALNLSCCSPVLSS